MTMSRPDSTASPLTVKEQFEASANRFWSSVRNLNIEETMKGSTQQRMNGSTIASSQESNTVQAAVSFQSVMQVMFGSCTTGASYEGFHNNRSLSAGSSISPTFSHGETSTEHQFSHSHPVESSGSSEENELPKPRLAKSKSSSPPVVPPVAPRTKFFQDNHKRAEEAVIHLREQQLQQQQDLEQKNLQHQRQKEYERIVSSRAPTTKSSPTQDSNENRATPISRTGKEHPSFFPVSKPSTAKDPPGLLHTVKKPGVPKEVSSPPRRGKAGDKGAGTTHPTSGSNHGDDLFDFDDDGVSVITQETVDEMMRQLEQQQRDFPNDFLLNRVYSDDTDPVDQSFGLLKKQCASSEGEAHTENMSESFPPLEGRNMSPPRLTRQNRSSETRSFFTKTTNSSHTDDFSAWKQEEQQYWDSQVAKDEFSETCFDKNSAKGNIIRLGTKSGSSKSNRQMTPPSLRSRQLQRVRDKVKRNVVRLNTTRTVSSGEVQGVSNPNPASVPAQDWQNDQLMDAMILRDEGDFAEI